MKRSIGWFAAAALALGTVQAHAQAPASVERGRYLTNTTLACGNCHFQRGPQGQPLAQHGLSGGMVFDEAAFRAYASNITPDPETGIGRWTDAQLSRAIRDGIRPDGSVIGAPMPVAFYRHLSDEDLRAVVAYLRSQPAVHNPVPKSTYHAPLPANYGPAVASVATPSRADKVRYGKYVADIAHCMECHTPRNERGELLQDKWGAGGSIFKGPWGASVARNLTPHASGLKDWSDAQIEKAVRAGVDRHGQALRPPMGFGFYKEMSDEDMGALIAYLRTLPPQPFGGEPRK